MKPTNLPRALFFAASVLLALPWLTPCTLGVGTAASHKIATLTGGADASHLPTRELREMAARPGPPLKVTVQPFSWTAITDAELASAKTQRGAPLTASRLKEDIGQGLAVTLLATDIMTAAILEDSPNKSIAGKEVLPHQYTDRRNRLELHSAAPYVLLVAKEIAFERGAEKGTYRFVRAKGGARITVVSSQGSFFGLAHEIDYRGPGSEVVLLGDPTIQAGEQFIKGSAPDTAFRLDFARRSVTSSRPLR